MVYIIYIYIHLFVLYGQNTEKYKIIKLICSFALFFKTSKNLAASSEKKLAKLATFLNARREKAGVPGVHPRNLPGTPRPTIYKWTEMVISNHFLYKDLVHHPIDSQPFINGWPWGSRYANSTIPGCQIFKARFSVRPLPACPKKHGRSWICFFCPVSSCPNSSPKVPGKIRIFRNSSQEPRILPQKKKRILRTPRCFSPARCFGRSCSDTGNCLTKCREERDCQGAASIAPVPT